MGSANGKEDEPFKYCLCLWKTFPKVSETASSPLQNTHTPGSLCADPLQRGGISLQAKSKGSHDKEDGEQLHFSFMAN